MVFDLDCHSWRAAGQMVQSRSSSEPKYLQAAVGHKLFLLQFFSSLSLSASSLSNAFPGQKQSNLLQHLFLHMQICCFVISLGKAKRHGSLVVANATGTAPSWHATKQRDAPGGLRGGTRSVCSQATQPPGCLHITAQSGWAPKIPSQSCLGFE